MIMRICKRGVFKFWRIYIHTDSELSHHNAVHARSYVGTTADVLQSADGFCCNLVVTSGNRSSAPREQKRNANQNPDYVSAAIKTIYVSWL